MQAAAARLYEGRSIGTVERWRNPQSNDAGEVTLVKSFETHGMPCRTIAYAIEFATTRDRLDRYRVNWCRVSGGTWKIVELGEPQ
jgi:surface antigen